MGSRRILLVSHEMTPSGAPFALFYLGSWLQRNGWQALVAAPDEQITSQSHHSTHESQLMTGLRGRVAAIQ